MNILYNSVQTYNENIFIYDLSIKNKRLENRTNFSTFVTLHWHDINMQFVIIFYVRGKVNTPFLNNAFLSLKYTLSCLEEIIEEE